MLYRIRERFSVPYDYPVVFTRCVFAPEHRLLRDLLCADGRAAGPLRIAVCVDSGLAAARPGLLEDIRRWMHAHHPRVVAAGAIQPVPGGEQAKKHLRTTLRLVEYFLQIGLCRHSFVLAIGGGAVLDAVGLAAALAHRGIRLIRMPTTTLAQADAGIGVKNGVNYRSAKNAIGTFAPPFAVVNDLDWLDSLSDADWMAGVAEAIKVAMVRDRRFFYQIAAWAERLRARDGWAMEKVVRRCAQLHLEHIRRSGDPFERGSARPLDFGHWAAHALESLTRYRIGHGQAVAFGIRLDTLYAWRQGWMAGEDAAAVFRLLDRCGFHPRPAMRLKPLANPDRLLAGLDRFREHLGGELCVTFPRRIGEVFEVHAVDRRLMAQCLHELVADTGVPGVSSEPGAVEWRTPSLRSPPQRSRGSLVAPASRRRSSGRDRQDC